MNFPLLLLDTLSQGKQDVERYGRRKREREREREIAFTDSDSFLF